MAGFSYRAAATAPSFEKKQGGVGWREALQAGIYIGLLVWLNAYICRELFSTERAPMGSMHGFWSAIAKWGAGWLTPAWWPYWDCGIPFEFTYAPLAPGITALWAALRGIPQTLAFESLTGFIYCIGPVTLFLMAWLLTRMPGYSFGASLVYSLTAPSRIITPDSPSLWQNFWDARRLYVMAAWDETPHMIAMALLPLAVLFLALAIRRPRWIYRVCAVVVMAGMALASAFGPVEIVMAAVCLLCVSEREFLGRNLRTVVLLGACAYAISSPFLTPSLIAAMHASAEHEGAVWAMGSITAFAIVILGYVVLWRYLRKWTGDWWLQFVALFFYLLSCPTLLATYFHRQFLPQPNRYNVELELGFALVAAFWAQPWLAKLPGSVKAPLLFVLLAFAGEQIVHHREFAKELLRPADPTQTVEYRAATWTAQHLPGTRVMMPGTIAQWTNTFTQAQQFMGGSWSMAYNPVQQRAVYAAYQSTGNPVKDSTLTWLRAYGVGAVCVSGKNSPEFWKPFHNPERFASLLPVLWQEQDTTIYRIPQPSASLAHVVPQSALVRRKPAKPNDVNELDRYVAALDDAALPPADFEWQGRNRIRIHADVRTGQVISVQVNYHPGWHAMVDHAPAEIGRDGLGLIWIRSDRTGPLDVQLEYNGGFEFRFFRWVSGLTILWLIGWPLMRRPKKT